MATVQLEASRTFEQWGEVIPLYGEQVELERQLFAHRIDPEPIGMIQSLPGNEANVAIQRTAEGGSWSEFDLIRLQLEWPLGLETYTVVPMYAECTWYTLPRQEGENQDLIRTIDGNCRFQWCTAFTPGTGFVSTVEGLDTSEDYPYIGPASGITYTYVKRQAALPFYAEGLSTTAIAKWTFPLQNGNPRIYRGADLQGAAGNPSYLTFDWCVLSDTSPYDSSLVALSFDVTLMLYDIQLWDHRSMHRELLKRQLNAPTVRRY